MDEISSEVVTVNRLEGGIVHVQFNRPDKMNALNMEMFEAVIAVGESLIEDKSVRVVVLSGAGRSFCAGLDLSMFGDGSKMAGPALGSPEAGSAPNLYQNIAWVWKQVPVPVIAAVHGVCFGGGLQIALAADIRYADPATRFSVMESKWGLIPDMSGSQTLRDLVRLDIAKELTFTGRIVEAVEAQEIGLVTRVVEQPLDAALELAESLVNKNPDCLTWGKQLLEQAWHGPTIDGLLLEDRLQKAIIGSNNQKIAVMAELSKQTPEFEPRQAKDLSDF